ncbi:hypothetical protein [Stieleria mannarensis]|nr:hypothetical protein [Rhodopirellula sp. JC639]
MQTLIQTNHGISYPVVGPNRIPQEDLIQDDEVPDGKAAKQSSTTDPMGT